MRLTLIYPLPSPPLSPPPFPKPPPYSGREKNHDRLLRNDDHVRRRREHIAELHNARPKQPFFFLKPPSSILSPGGGPVLRPRGVVLHYEVELALVMGREVRDLEEGGDERGWVDAVECIYSLARASFLWK